MYRVLIFGMVWMLFLPWVSAQNQVASRSFSESEVFDNKIFRLLHFEKLPTDAQRRQWAREGLRLVDYYPKNQYFAVVDVGFEGWDRIPHLRKVEPVPDRMRLHAAFTSGQLPEWAYEGDYWKVVVGYYEGLDAERVKAALEKVGLEITEDHSEAHMYWGRIPADRFQQLAELPFVQFIDLPGPPPELEADEYYRSGITRANVVHRLNPSYSGEGIRVMVSEGRVDSIPQLSGRLVVLNTSSTVSSHATDVASHMAGAAIENPSTNNNAYQATVYSQNYTTDYGYYYNTYRVLYTNHSLGFGVYGGYDAVARLMDELARDYPVVAVSYSAGNSGTATGYAPYNTFSGWANATGERKQNKNQFETGATDRLGQLTWFSSRGPTYDGRVYPVVVTEGSGGTSFAAPKTTGALAVLQKIWLDHHPGDTAYAMRLRAILTVSADDHIENPGIDFKTGYGMINLRRAREVIANNWIFFDSVSNGFTKTHTFTVPAGLAQLRVMLMWPDEAAAVGAPKALVNDLDVLLISPAGDTFRPWVLNHYPHPDSLNAPAVRKTDTLNNAELVTVDAPAAGTWTVSVTGSHVPMGPQAYYVAYDLRPFELVVTFPHDSLTFLSTEDMFIYWDWYDTASTGQFTIKYQLDGGGWTTITSTVPHNRRAYQWNVPSVGPGIHEIRVVVERGGLSDTSGIVFVSDSAVAAMYPGCVPGYILWDSVPGMGDYQVWHLDSTKMVPLTSGVTTTATGAHITSLNLSQSHRLAAVPINGPAHAYWYSSVISLTGTVNNSPFFEGFEDNASPAPPVGVDTLANGWRVSPSPAGTDLYAGPYRWLTYGPGGTPSSGTGPSAPYAGQRYAYTEASGSNNGDVATLTSPCVSLDGTTNPVLGFAYHMYGTGMGTLEVQIRLGGTSSWTTLLSHSGDQGTAWYDTLVDLAAYAGDTIQIRFRAVRGSSYTSDAAVDSVQIIDVTQPDVGVVSIDSPVAGCGLGTVEPVWITIRNYGILLSSGTTIPYSVVVNGGTPCNGTLTVGAGGLAFGADTTFNSGCTGNFSAVGNHTIDAWTSLGSDANSANDSSSVTIESILTRASFPYVETFEGTHGWTFGGTNSSWAVGTPSSTDIDQPGEGNLSLVTNPTGNYNNNENSWAMSPCYDFSGLTVDPVVSFLHAWEIEGTYDEGWLEYSLDNGATWTKLGTSGNGVNWYNDAANDWWDASTGYNDWHVASYPLTGLAGQSSVRFRFVLNTDYSVTYEGIAVDQFSVLPGGYEVFDPSSRPYTHNSTMVAAGAGWVKYQLSGGDVIWLNPNGLNLGNTDFKFRTAFPPLYFSGPNQYMTPRHWVIDPTTQPAIPVKIRLFLTEEEWDTLQARDANLSKGINQLGVTHYHGPNDGTLSWADNDYVVGDTDFIAPSSIEVYPWNNGYALEFDVIVMSQFGGNSGGGTETPIPVELAWFRAERVGGDALLTWATASERNSAYFRVEVATEVVDGVPVFRTLGTVEAAGESSELLEYRYVDREPGKRGVRYYRIVEVDYDGRTTVSEVRKLDFGGASLGVLVRPNPVGEVLELVLPSGEGAADVRVEDVRGRVMWEGAVPLGDEVRVHRVSARAWPTGSYVVRVAVDDRVEYVKVVKR